MLFTTIVGSIWILLIMMRDCLSKIANPIKYEAQVKLQLFVLCFVGYLLECSAAKDVCVHSWIMQRLIVFVLSSERKTLRR